VGQTGLDSNVSGPYGYLGSADDQLHSTPRKTARLFGSGGIAKRQEHSPTFL